MLSTISTTAASAVAESSSLRRSGTLSHLGRAGSVREGWREVLRSRQPHALLERGSRQLGARCRAVRQGLDRVLPRLPEPGTPGNALADREVPEVLRGRPDE